MKHAYAENGHSSGLCLPNHSDGHEVLSSCGKPDFWLHLHGCNTNTSWGAFLTDLAGRRERGHLKHQSTLGTSSLSVVIYWGLYFGMRRIRRKIN